jgi:tuftelin-interacting protein 11
LATVLQEWNPLDSSANVIIAPWKGVFDDESIGTLLKRSIIPKLAMMMRSFEVNPRNQDIAPFNAFKAWENVIPIHQLVNMLETDFFPKWHQVLYTWLSSRPNYEEVSQWYWGWKQQFSQNMMSNEKIRTQFNHALHVMNSAMNGVPLPAHPPPMIPVHIPSTPKLTPVKQKPKDLDELSFKEVVETFADNNGFLLIPTGRRFEGKLIYNFGKIPIIFGTNILYKLEKGNWKPAGLEELLVQ